MAVNVRTGAVKMRGSIPVYRPTVGSDVAPAHASAVQKSRNRHPARASLNSMDGEMSAAMAATGDSRFLARWRLELNRSAQAAGCSANPCGGQAAACQAEERKPVCLRFREVEMSKGRHS